VPIRLRLAALFALGAGLVIAVCGLLFVWQLGRGLATSTDNGLRARAVAIVPDLGQPPSTTTIGSTPTAGTGDLGDNLYQVIDRSGRVVQRSNEVDSTPLVDTATLERARSAAVFSTVGPEEHQKRVLAVPVTFEEQPSVLLVATSTETNENAVERVRNIFVLAAGPLVALAAVAAWLLAGAALRPVEHLRRQVAQLSEEDLSDGVEVPGTHDELAQLAVTMNDLLGRVRRARVRERGFVAEAGHELRTPLAIMRAELELAARPGRSNEELVEAIGVAGEETERLTRLAEHLLLLARNDDDDDTQLRRRFGAVDMTQLLERATQSARARVDGQDIRIELDAPGDLVVMGDSDRMRQAVDNLLDNAVRYAPPGSLVTVTGRTDDSRLRITVTDEGPGFEESFLPRAFQRFARGDDARADGSDGAGLGLAIVQSIVETHGGTAEARNTDPGGAAVTIDIPLSAQCKDP
jgi:heavy metal sensor kinase